MKVLALSGYIPEQIGDIVRFTGFQADQSIPYYCGYASDFISQVIQDKSVDRAVFPRSCDSCRVMDRYLEGVGKRIYLFNVPQSVGCDSKEYFSNIIRAYAEWYWETVDIDQELIKWRIELINKRNAEICRIYSDIEEISYAEYINSIHSTFMKSLSDQTIGDIAEISYNGQKKVFVIGSFLATNTIARIIEECDMKVVGDDLPESGRLSCACKTKVGGNIFDNIADSMLQSIISPTSNNYGKCVNRVIKEIKEKAVNGVIFVIQKYCEPYEYLYTVYANALDQIGIPYTKVVCVNSQEALKAKLILEAFANTI